MKRLRFWLIGKLFTDLEKYDLAVAIDGRISELEKLRVFSKMIDKDNANEDIAALQQLKTIFSTKHYQ